MANTKARFLPLMLALCLLLSCMAPAAFADDLTHPADPMAPVKTVYPIGTETFYKVNGTVVTYADGDDGSGWTAVPSALISGSEYNTAGIAYGLYVTDDGAVHSVDLALCHQDGDAYFWVHGTADSASVSSSVDTADNTDHVMGTDFWLNIEKDAIDPDGTTEESVVITGTDDPRVEYELTVSVRSAYQLDVTVPLYVCMYGFGGDGSIVEPTSDAYRLENHSTSNAGISAEIVDITRVTHYTRIYDENHSNEDLYAIAYNTETGAYQYWYSMPTVELAPEWVYYVIPEGENINASGQCYVLYMDEVWNFRAAGVLEGDAMKETVSAVDAAHPLSEDLLYGPEDCWNFGTTPAVGDRLEGGKNVGMPVLVSGIQATPHTWKLVGVDTPVSDLRRGQLTMSIAPERASSNASAIDLSAASAKLDITERGWMVDAPTADEDGTVTAPASLGLIVQAQMAGGGVNDAGCTGVVTVSYTVIPQADGRSLQTGTADASAVQSNRG